MFKGSRIKLQEHSVCMAAGCWSTLQRGSPAWWVAASPRKRCDVLFGHDVTLGTWQSAPIRLCFGSTPFPERGCFSFLFWVLGWNRRRSLEKLVTWSTVQDLVAYHKSLLKGVMNMFFYSCLCLWLCNFLF